MNRKQQDITCNNCSDEGREGRRLVAGFVTAASARAGAGPAAITSARAGAGTAAVSVVLVEAGVAGAVRTAASLAEMGGGAAPTAAAATAFF